MPPKSKFPILLTREHWYTRLVIAKAHKRVLHNGIKETLTEIRSKYWIIRGITRAVHLDIVDDLLPKSFVKCLKRFAARRGVPWRIITDNGITFVAASKTLKEIICHL